MRRFLDRLYAAGGAIGAVFIALICALMIAQSVLREFGVRTGAVNDVAAGHVSAMVAPVHTVMPLVKAGKLKMLAVLSSERVSQLPQVPSFKEHGLPKVQVDIWYGLMAPKGTAPQVVQSLNQEVNLVLKNPEIVANLAKQGIDAGGGSSQLMADTLSAELKRWPPVVKAAQIKAD
jgi:tripartite-type tricarboxylate transporter receptor subunit TctC